MSKNEKQLSERMLLDFLRNGVVGFPVGLRVVETRKESLSKIVGAIVEMTWNEMRFLFAVETKLRFHPKAIREAAEQITRVAEQLDVHPLIVTPYLSDEQLEALEKQKVSGLDMCGNGVILVPDRLLIYRTGNPNKYPSSAAIRNVYRGTSSLAARIFLIQPEYATSQELFKEVADRGGRVNLSTVSKVCSSLADDLIISREKQGRKMRLRLLQPEKLLGRLAENYEAPKCRQELTGKLTLDEENFQTLLKEWTGETAEQVVRTGASSSERYATMAREPVSRYYCTDLTGLLERLGDSLRETERFPNLQLLETDDPTVYFDIRDEFDASPLQTYLELNAGDKRERETAEQIGRQTLEKLNR